ncbi:MAG TPA: DJ-1/PfpI family protein [Thermoanaerobaculales bacterium]|nr:DJ-1/PfpI family protein [Thermoanaerobaculales bacterium]HPA81106.1 DJ-1/PfpI family protein [Thermoanaerobaculales bacterium]HQL28890.1 DJ-1/PfpI family protein [Thermoanaerobaculales bacterium]HQN96381.1 DJ-1/PfpI family protein [Thermoanaerobaculales bacterium]HQP44247.1 DJ-1/PfpI family protein [Thermoanaerobaculales bacterium]
MKRVLLLLCDGVEILEAGALFDVLGWASAYGSEPVEVVPVGLQSEVVCCFGLRVVADRALGDVRADDFDALALPGGFVEHGFDECALSQPVAALIRRFDVLGRPIAAICTGGVAVAASGVLRGRRGTTYKLLGGGRRRQLASFGAEVVDSPVVTDGVITTSAGPSTAAEVALRLLEQLTGADNASHIRHLMGFDRDPANDNPASQEGA